MTVQMQPLPNSWTVPQLSAVTAAWFTSGRLALQKCAECRHVQHPPEEVCRACGATTFSHVDVAPTGVIHSYTIVHHPVHESLADAVPYAVVLVALDDAPGIRVVGNMPGTDRTDIAIGTGVEAFWVERGDTLLPQWRLRQHRP